MNATSILKKGYKGDEAWNNFVAAFRPNWSSMPGKEDLVQLCAGEDFAIVLSYIVGAANIPNWWDRPLPALGGIPPKQFRGKERDDVIILRAVMMRMPV